MVAIHSEISCRRVPAALNIFIFSRFTALHLWRSSHPHSTYVHTGLKINLNWTSGDVMHFVKSFSAKKVSSLPGLHPCCLTHWTLDEHQAVMHIKMSFLDSQILHFLIQRAINYYLCHICFITAAYKGNTSQRLHSSDLEAPSVFYNPPYTLMWLS